MNIIYLFILRSIVSRLAGDMITIYDHRVIYANNIIFIVNRHSFFMRYFSISLSIFRTTGRK